MEDTKQVYCQKCGSTLTEAVFSGRSRLACEHCGFVLYQNPVPGAGVIVEIDDGIVLIRRGHDPMKGMWALPAGFIEADESIEEAAIRECKEETGLDIELLEMFGVDSFPEGPTQSGIIIFYRAKQIGGILEPGDDAADAAVFPADNLPHNVAFRTHRAVITRWANQRGVSPKFDYSLMTDDLLGDEITIREGKLGDEAQIIKLLKYVPANQRLSDIDWQSVQLRFRESTSLEVLIAELNNQEVGFLVLSFVSALTGLRAWIDDLAVDPVFRRKGIGQALVEAGIRRASERGATHLFLDTSRGNPDARDFYSACGFDPNGVTPIRIR